MSDFYKETKITARKTHRCEEAGRSGCVRTAEIMPGQLHVRCFGVTDGRAWTIRLCSRCARIYKKAHNIYNWDGDNKEGPLFGCLREWIREARS